VPADEEGSCTPLARVGVRGLGALPRRAIHRTRDQATDQELVARDSNLQHTAPKVDQRPTRYAGRPRLHVGRFALAASDREGARVPCPSGTDVARDALCWWCDLSPRSTAAVRHEVLDAHLPEPEGRPYGSGTRPRQYREVQADGIR
jgi:hypothetical protein